MTKLHTLALTASVLAGSTFVPAIAVTRPLPVTTAVRTVPTTAATTVATTVPVPDCPAEPPIARLRWNWNNGNQRAVIAFLKRCFPDLLNNLPDSLK